jgi:acetyl-CoA synthetase
MERMQTYEQLYASFRRNIPARYNIAADVCDRHATDPGKIALIGEGPDGKVWQMTFRDVQRKANKLANFLLSIGLVKGDRVMLLLGRNLRGPPSATSPVGKPGSSPCRCRCCSRPMRSRSD